MKNLWGLIDLVKLLVVRAFEAFDARAIKGENERRQYERDRLEDKPADFFNEHFGGVSKSSDNSTKSGETKGD